MKLLARTPNDIGHALRQARRRMKWTQRQLSENSGIRQETISRVENGSPGTRLETLFDLCAALNLELIITERSQGTHDFLTETL